MSEPLKKTYPKLMEREKKYQRYAKPKQWLWSSVLFVIFLDMFIFVLLNSLRFPVSIFYAYAYIFAWFAIATLSCKYLDRKIRVFRLNADERVMLYACSAYDNLENYFSNQKPELKKEYKKIALLQTKNLLSTIEKRWKIGNACMQTLIPCKQCMS